MSDQYYDGASCHPHALAPQPVAAGYSFKELLDRLEYGKSVFCNDMTITGTVTTRGELHVNGEFHGDIHCLFLTVSETGKVYGDVFADTAVVAGRVLGRVRAGDVVLRSQAHVEGDIEHATLRIEPGARFEGSVKRVRHESAFQETIEPDLRETMVPALIESEAA